MSVLSAMFSAVICIASRSSPGWLIAYRTQRSSHRAHAIKDSVRFLLLFTGENRIVGDLSVDVERQLVARCPGLS